MAEELCMLCGAVKPPGHVVVQAPDGTHHGRVCSSHTLKELLFDSQERFLVEIIVSDPAIEALERAEARHRELALDPYLDQEP
jgi:hypothetical protein